MHSLQIWSWFVRNAPYMLRKQFVRKYLSTNFKRYADTNFSFFSRQLGISWSARTYPDALTRYMLYDGLYQKDVMYAMKNFLHTGQVFYDIGAHYGLMAVYGRKLVGESGKVVAFEPNPLVEEIFWDNVKVNNFRNVVLEKIGIMDKTDVMSFYPQEGDISWNSSFVSSFFSNEEKTFKVKTETLDSYVDRSPHKPDFIKIDAEGAEIFILNGAMRTIEKYKPIIIVELNEISAQAAKTSISAVVTNIRNLGYEILVPKSSRWRRFFNNYVGFTPINLAEISDIANAICVPKDKYHEGTYTQL